MGHKNNEARDSNPMIFIGRVFAFIMSLITDFGIMRFILSL